MGERQARFEAVYAAYRTPVLGYALRRTLSPDDAADILAETFLVAWRKLDQIPPEYDGESAGIAAALRRLPEDQREVLTLSAWEGLDYGQMATVLGCSRNAVLTQITPVTDVTVARLTSPAAYDELAARIMAVPIAATDPEDLSSERAVVPPPRNRFRRLRPMWRLAIAAPLAAGMAIGITVAVLPSGHPVLTAPRPGLTAPQPGLTGPSGRSPSSCSPTVPPRRRWPARPCPPGSGSTR